MAKSDFTLAFNEITEVHHLPREVVVDALKQALISAYRRDGDIGSAQRIDAEVDPVTNQYQIFVEKEVVDEVISEGTEIAFAEARKRYPTCAEGDVVMAPVEANTKTFGRIAAQTAKQVILQKIREAERLSLYEEYKDREGDLVTGTVQNFNSQQITLSLGGRAEAVMPAKEQIRGERFRTHDKVRVLIAEVKESARGPQIIVSRGHKNMLRRLLEFEVPEIYNGQVQIKSIAREPGQRSKVAVVALQPGIDPVGACVGIRGGRIQNIVKELHDEKIDVIEWSQDASQFIAKALSPARVTGVFLEDDIDNGNTATVIVPDDQLSLAIGREGQNARLAAKLTGWRVDIKGATEAAFAAFEQLESEAMAKVARDMELVAEVSRILEKKRADRMVLPEEYQTLTRFVQLAEQGMLESREQNRQRRRKVLEKARMSVPRKAFQMQLESLELEKEIVTVLRSRNIANVGDLMMRLSAESDNLKAALEAAQAGEDAMEAIQLAVISLVLDGETEGSKAEATAEVSAPVAEAGVSPAESVATAEGRAEEIEDEAPPAFPDVEESTMARLSRFMPRTQPRQPAPRPAVAKPAPQADPAAPVPASVEAAPGEDAEAGDDSDAKRGKKGKKAGKHRELIFDEDRGEVVVKRKRKGGRAREAWETDEE